ncbi:hypothetical protein [Arcticibacter sp. MXS-1]|uniref:hypothetical protein n=1 Tax=Arcticibacter sp. MXS-1 TaxID=3341726 RepID=UPI0035A92F95
MIQFSTLPSGLFAAEDLDLDYYSTLSQEDEAFYKSLKKDLDNLSKEPQTDTIQKLLSYSAKLSRKQPE